MKLFVTGSTGFIGSHFVRAALAAGNEVIGLRYPGTQPVIPIPDSNRLTWVDGDLNSFFSGYVDSRSPERVAPSGQSSGLSTRAVPSATCSTFSSPLSPPSSILHPPLAEGHSALVHLAAYGVSPQPCTWGKAFQISVLDSLALMERAVEAGVRKIVVCGSCVEYGNSAEHYANIPPNAPLEPVGPYAASKAAQSIAASALCREKGIELAILRLFTVFGEGQHPDNLWPSLKRAALAGEDFPMTPGGQIRDFIPVEQVAQAFLKALENQFESAKVEKSASRSLAPKAHLPTLQPSHSVRIANVGIGRPQTILEFAQHWWKEWGATGKLLPGALPYRDNEVMRYVPEVAHPLLP